MREDIFTEVNGQKVIDIHKVFGKGYERGYFANCPVRYRLFEGARSTKKSKDIIGYEPLMKILSDERRNIVMIRMNDCDNRQSTFENLVGCIYDLGLETDFVWHTNPLEIILKRTGQKIVFRGFNSPTSLNSITFARGYLTDIYIEEAFEIESYMDFRKLDGSLRGKLPDGLFQQITMCFNAWDGDTWLYEIFFKGRLEDDYETLDRDDVTYMDYYDPEFIGDFGKGLYLHKSTYKINEFRDKEVYDLAAKNSKEIAPEIYKVEFLGMFGVTSSAVYDCWNNELVVPIQHIIGIDDYGQPNMDFMDFCIGIDTGLSTGEGKEKRVSKTESVDKKIKAATTMCLCAISADRRKLIAIDEYFHSNNKSDNDVNTDNRDVYTEPQQMKVCAEWIQKWIRKYSPSPTMLMKGVINIYVDSADIGFRQGLELELNNLGIYSAECIGSTKKRLRMRISFTNLLMAYKEFIVCDQCKNLIRELKNARKGDKGEPRKDGNDHIINASEYGFAPFYQDVIRWKDYKPH